MRLFPLPLFLVAATAWARALPPEVNSASPDKAWVITARWIGGETSAAGYDWDLRNVKTGKVYFREVHQDNEGLPYRFDVVWNQNSRYAAIDLYYGRLLYDVDVISVSGAPQSMGLPLTPPGVSPGKAFLHPEDIDSFHGYQPPLRVADKWINDIDLSVGLSFAAYLTDRKSGKKYILHGDWRQTVRFDEKAGEVVQSVNGSYDKDPDQN